MLSGIGDSTQLEPLGIETIVESAQVGQNLQDHPVRYLTLSLGNRALD